MFSFASLAYQASCSILCIAFIRSMRIFLGQNFYFFTEPTKHRYKSKHPEMLVESNHIFANRLNNGTKSWQYLKFRVFTLYFCIEHAILFEQTSFFFSSPSPTQVVSFLDFLPFHTSQAVHPQQTKNIRWDVFFDCIFFHICAPLLNFNLMSLSSNISNSNIRS